MRKIIIQGIPLNPEKIDKEIDLLKLFIIQKIGLNNNEFKFIRILKRSLDLRQKRSIKYIYNVEIEVEENDMVRQLDKSDLKNMNYSIKYKKKNYTLKIKNSKTYSFNINTNKKSIYKPIIIGFGPAGIFAADILSENGYNPIILEQGSEIHQREKEVKDFKDNRNLNINSNIQFGEGGAGTFSDGKLYSLINDERVNEVFHRFVEAGAPEEILYNYKPHIGTDNIRKVIINLRKKILSNGGQIYFNHKLINFDEIFKDNKRLIKIFCQNGKEYITDRIIIAVGNGARDTFRLLEKKKVDLESKTLSVGFRIEHPQEWLNNNLYGQYIRSKKININLKDVKPIFPQGIYKLNYRRNKSKRGVYTFCMCPGGYVVPGSSQLNTVVTNGMSKYSRDGDNANSAILINVFPEDIKGNDPLKLMEYQEKLESNAFKLGGENYNAPVQLVNDYIKDTISNQINAVNPTYKPGVKLANLNVLLNTDFNTQIKEGLQYFNKRIPGFINKDAILTGIETRSSSPVRILRNKYFFSSFNGIIPAGEGAGYAGGIVSAAVDGIRAAEALINSY